MAHTLAQIHAAAGTRIDLKPFNIMLDADGLPVVIDFGIVRSEHINTQITMVGVVIGTPNYMAPELMARAAPATAVGIYALGVVIYFMLTGRTPWPEPHLRLQFEDPDPSNLPGSLQLREVVQSALRADPAKRVSSAADLEAALLTTPELRGPEPGSELS